MLSSLDVLHLSNICDLGIGGADVHLRLLLYFAPFLNVILENFIAQPLEGLCHTLILLELALQNGYCPVNIFLGTSYKVVLIDLRRNEVF